MDKLTVMIIDDQDDLRTLLTDFLEEEGYDVISAGNGADALQCVKFKKPHLILLDALLPDMNGCEVSLALKADPSTAGVPIFFLADKEAVRDKLAGIVSEGHHYICKPFDLAELEHLIRLLLYFNVKKRAQADENASIYILDEGVS